MLLKVKTRTIDGKTALEAWEVGGRCHMLRAPFDPFYYSPYETQFVLCFISRIGYLIFWKKWA
jgi:hypothetical protein